MTSNDVQLVWLDGQPVSKNYGDVYFSRDSGLAETRHVFLEHNHLPERWAALTNTSFTIAETGFGTGLNFLCAWQLWEFQAPATAHLNFISTEKYPLSRDDLAQALSLWPQLAYLGKQLLAQYQWLAPGWHTLQFAQGRVTLTLLIGDARDTLPLLRAKVDAWFLDGFAPAKNPEMWQPILFHNMARLSHGRTTLATFTSAGEVRRGLQAAGFEVTKVRGYGRKRDMLCGQYVATQFTSLPTSHRAIVIGGGISGTASAHALAGRGWQVTLVERHAALAQEASGNPVAVLYPRLAGTDIALSRLALQGYLHTLRLLQGLNLGSDDYSACGLLQLAFDAKELIRCKAVAARDLSADVVRYMTAAQASEVAGIALSHDSLFFPAAGWVKPQALCEALARHENITVLPSAHALQLKQNASLWQAWGGSRLLAEAPVVVIGGANNSTDFQQLRHLPLEPVRGQVTNVRASPVSRDLKTVICTDGYLSPAIHEMHCLGATFSADDTSTEIRDSDHLANLTKLKKISPALYGSLLQSPCTGRAALRCVTPDYLPMAGPLLDSAKLLANPPRYTANPVGLPWLDGLFVNTGHGSKGLINAPLCAEMIACALNGEPSPVDAKLLATLDPNRFLLRKMGLKRLALGLAAYPLL